MMNRTTLVAMLACLLVRSAAMADQPAIEDGVYKLMEAGDGRVVRTSAILGERVTAKLGHATIRSMTNDNTRYHLRILGTGLPWSDEAVEPLVLVVDGEAMTATSELSLGSPDRVLIATVHGKEAATRVAERLGIEAEHREDPGHRLTVHWSPSQVSYKPDDVMAVTMTIRNTGDLPVAFQVGGKQRGPRDNQFRFLAYRAHGYGPAVPDTGDPMNMGGRVTMQTMQPGESYSHTVTLNHWFDLTEADTYRITGIFELQLHDPARPGDFWPIWDELLASDCRVVVAVDK